MMATQVQPAMHRSDQYVSSMLLLLEQMEKMQQKEKDKINSKKGAYYYKLDRKKYKIKKAAFLNLVSKAEKFI